MPDFGLAAFAVLRGVGPAGYSSKRLPLLHIRYTTLKLSPNYVVSYGLTRRIFLITVPSMSNKIINSELPVGARIRIGVPNDAPEAVVSALNTHFSSRPQVLSARLGLMEVLSDENSEGFFTYTIGILCSAPEHSDTEITAAMNAITKIPTGRWPISFFPPTEAYFTAQSITVYQAEAPTPKRGLLAKLLGMIT